MPQDLTHRAHLSQTSYDDLLAIREQALGMSHSAVAAADLDGRLNYANDSFLRLWGYTGAREVLGRRVTEFWESPNITANVFDAVLENGSWSGELMARRADGSLFRSQVSSRLVRDADGRPLCLVGSFLDISEQTEAFESLRMNEEKYRSLVENTSDWIWEVDRRGAYTYVSPKVRAILGYEPEDMLGKTPFDFMPPDRAEAVAATFKSHVASRTAFHGLENTNIHKSGQLVVLESSGEPVFDRYGRYAGFRGIDRDITVRRATQQALREARDELEQRVEERTRELERAYERLEKSEARYRAMLEAQTELICRFYPDGTLSYANDAYCRYYGKHREDLVGCYFKPHIPDEDRKRCEFHFAALTPRRPVGTLVHRSIMPDGEVLWQQWVDRAIFDDEGNVVEYQSVGRDVTASMLSVETVERAQREKDELRRKLEGVFRSISDAIITVDQDMRVIKKNRVLDDICSRAPLIIEGRDINAGFENGECPACVRLLRQVIETRQGVRGYRAECECGTRCNQVTMINASPLIGNNHEFEGAVIVIRDITRLEELEKRFEERSFHRNIVGRCERMQGIYNILDQLSDLKTTVLIMGESGTGKELIVEALHYGSTTITGPLVKVNCAALAENLLESELFGHVRGAFTGAVQDRMGRFQAAEGGTIFLDEIGDLSPSTQLKLLRVLESKEYERVGDSTTCTADVRVVAATNRDLAERVRQGLFREDLYYRLKVMVVEVPPLRERMEDIPLLMNHFLEHYREVYNKDIQGVTDEVMELFMRHRWPGNVRELKHSLEHASILCPGGLITRVHLPSDFHGMPSGLTAPSAAPGDAPSGRARLLEVLGKAHWNKTLAARMLGVSRTTLYRKMRTLGIEE